SARRQHTETQRTAHSTQHTAHSRGVADATIEPRRSRTSAVCCALCAGAKRPWSLSEEERRLIRAVDRHVTVGAPAVAAARLVGRILLDVDVALDAQPAAEHHFQLPVRRAVRPVALQARLAHAAHRLDWLVLIDKWPADLLMALEAGLLDRA